MKKFLIALFVILLSACSLGKANTPTQKVEELLDKYKNQKMKFVTLSELKKIIF